LAAVSGRLAAGALVLTAVNLGTVAPSGLRARPGDLPLTLALLTFALVGAVVASRRPRNAIGWLLIAEGLSWTLALFCQGYAVFALYTRPGSLALPELAATVVASIWVPAIMLLPLLFLLFPDGRPPSARWRPVLWLAAGVGIAVWTASALRPGALLHVREVVVDRTLVAAGLAAFVTLVYLVLVAGIGAAIASTAGAHVGLSTLATAIIAVAFQPLRAWLHRHVSRLVYRSPIAEPDAAAEPVRETSAPELLAPPEVAVRTLGGFRMFRGRRAGVRGCVAVQEGSDAIEGPDRPPPAPDPA
jgi:hypothetical protein